MAKKYTNLWDFIQSSWQTRASFVFCVLWLWFVGLALAVPDVNSLYTYVHGTNGVIGVFSESALYWYISGIVFGIAGYVVGLIWVLKKCANVYTQCHWVDLIIKRLLYGIIFVLIMGVAIMALWTACVELPIAAVGFSFICIVSLIVAFVISGMFVRESLITEANIKAKEVYNNKQRSKIYKK